MALLKHMTSSKIHKLEHIKKVIFCLYTKSFPTWSKDTKLRIKNVNAYKYSIFGLLSFCTNFILR